MKKLYHIANMILEGLAGFSTICFTGLVFAQIVARKVFDSPFHWQEEVCLYFFILLILCGTILSMRNKGHICVDIIEDHLKPKARLVLDVINEVLTLACCAYYTYAGYMLFANIGNRLSGELRIPMKYVYIVLPISGIFLCLYSVISLVSRIQALKGKGNVE